MLSRAKLHPATAQAAPAVDALFASLMNALAHCPKQFSTPLNMALTRFQHDPLLSKHAHDPFVMRLIQAIAQGCNNPKFSQDVPPIPGNSYEKQQGEEAPKAPEKPPAPKIPEKAPPPPPKKPGE